MKQYIGARYVPIFFEGKNGSEWQSGVSYDALTIVTYLRNSYTSKIPVPATVGNPADNPTYWVATGQFNEQVQDYKKETELVKNKISQSDRKYVFIADSYGTPLHSGGWIKQVAYTKGLTENVNFWQSAKGGACFGDGSYGTMLQNLANSITKEMREAITDVVVQGSINDYLHSNSDINRELYAVETIVQSEFPNARFWLPLIGWAYNPNNIRGEILRAYNCYNEKARFAQVINDVYLQLLNPSYFEEDGVHPNNLGMYYLSWSISNVLNGGNVYIKANTDLMTMFTGTQGGNIILRGNICANGYNIWKNENVGLRYTTAITVPGPSEEPLTIATATKANGNELFMQMCKLPVRALYAKSNNTYVTGNAILTISKVPDINTWNMGITSVDIIGSDFPVSDVIGIYFQINAYVDLLRN